MYSTAQPVPIIQPSTRSTVVIRKSLLESSLILRTNNNSKVLPNMLYLTMRDVTQRQF